MSPSPAPARSMCQSFPRVSGDEPAVPSFDGAQVKFSPRERG